MEARDDAGDGKGEAGTGAWKLPLRACWCPSVRRRPGLGGVGNMMLVVVPEYTCRGIGVCSVEREP